MTLPGWLFIGSDLIILRCLMLTIEMALVVAPAMNMKVLLVEIAMLRVLRLAPSAPVILLAVALTIDMALPGVVLAFRPVMQIRSLLGAVTSRTGPGLILTSFAILCAVALTIVMWPLL